MSSCEDEEYLIRGGVRWLLTEDERQNLAHLLNIEVPDALDNPKGNKMTTPRRICNTCGKRSGLDDMVQNAIALGIHNRDFMLDVLLNGPKPGSPAHTMSCSRCGQQFRDGDGPHTFAWDPDNWCTVM